MGVIQSLCMLRLFSFRKSRSAEPLQSSVEKGSHRVWWQFVSDEMTRGIFCFLQYTTKFANFSFIGFLINVDTSFILLVPGRYKEHKISLVVWKMSRFMRRFKFISIVAISRSVKWDNIVKDLLSKEFLFSMIIALLFSFPPA